MATPNLEEATDYAAQSRDFLEKSRDYLAAGDLHQASEKGWGAASHMLKAVAVAQGREYARHSDFNRLLNELALEGGNDRYTRVARRRQCSPCQLLRTQAEPERRDYPQGPGQRGGVAGPAGPNDRAGLMTTRFDGFYDTRRNGKDLSDSRGRTSVLLL